jgi:hypothetical protein
MSSMRCGRSFAGGRTDGEHAASTSPPPMRIGHLSRFIALPVVEPKLP